MTTMDRRPGDAKRILVLCRLDGYANGQRPVEIERFLNERGHAVRLVDTRDLALSARSARVLGRRLPALRPGRLALLVTEEASGRLARGSGRSRHFLSYYLLIADHWLRRAILNSALPLDDFDLVICEYPADAELLTTGTSAVTFYDCPAPRADEEYFEGKLTERQHRKLRRRETALFEGVDHLAFHWESYARYTVEHYGITGHNLMTLNHGCAPASQRARFHDPPRAICLGYLGMRFVNLPLLARLNELYPYIDVYGGPPPDPSLGLNYLGYAPSLDVLARYQLGLVTCSQDPLRQDGFSSKHLQYLAYGLPVLVPAWRRHPELEAGAATYTEETFRSVVEKLADEQYWQTVSDDAYDQAGRLTWDETLRPLEALLARLP